MRRLWSLASALLVALVSGVAGVGAQTETGVPATMLPPPETRAVSLEDGTLHVSAEATAEVRARFPAGRVFQYYGETTDAFGRTWNIVGDPDAWRRRRTWLVLPEEFARDLEIGTATAFLDTLGTPAASGVSRRAVRVSPGWWHEPRVLTVTESPRPGELLGVPAYRIPAALLEELIGLVGGLESFGPWPENPARGQIHVGRFLPLVWFWNDGWVSGQPVRTLAPVLGLVGNPLLSPDSNGPAEITGLHVPCWRLMGGLDPAGSAVGRTLAAPEEPAMVPGGARGDDPLGARDFSRLAWPTADEEVAAPRRVLLEAAASGVVVEDNSTRQAVYLQQSLPAGMTAALRGRTLRLRVRARAVPEGETTPAVAVAIEVEAGSARESAGAQVGVRSTPLSVELLVPEDAETITVRLLPQDRSIAVAERGRAVFDLVALAPVEWPERLTPDALSLRRTLVVGYERSRSYTRAQLAVSERPEEELATTFPALGERDVEERRLILAGRLDAGMGAEAVRLAWGEPESVATLDGLERWDWPDRSAALRGDVLTAWTTTPRDRKPRAPGSCLDPTEDER